MTFPSAPLEAPAAADGPRIHRRQLAHAINRTMAGKLNANAAVTLTANATSTTLTDPRLGPNTAILFMPQTANAAAAKASLFVPSATQTTGSAVINHASSANADQTFTLLLIG